LFIPTILFNLVVLKKHLLRLNRIELKVHFSSALRKYLPLAVILNNIAIKRQFIIEKQKLSN
ncbi:hypothetical protein JSO54_10205, partial [Riemerella anatipestifer]